MAQEINLKNPSAQEKFQLLRKWQHVIDEVGVINVYDTHFELAWICEAASRSNWYLEVGSFKGASMKAAMLANPELHAVTLDTFDDPGVEDEYTANLQSLIDSGRVMYLKGNSQDGFKKIFAESDGRMFDFVFIDASHLYHDVKQDIEDAQRLLIEGGILSGHDYRKGLPEDGVTRSVREALPHHFNPIDSIWCA